MKRLFLILLLTLPAHAAVLTLDQYAAALARLRALVTQNQRAIAATEAQALIGSEVQSVNGTFRADDSVLGEIVNTKSKHLRIIDHLDTELAQLRRVAGATIAPQPNDKLLEQVAKEEEVEELKKGGGILATEPPKGPWYERVGKMIADFFQWVADRLQDFVDWLEKFWPQSDDSPQKRKAQSSANIRWIVGGLIVLIIGVIAVLAWEVMRRSRGAQEEAVEESAPLGSKADEDPLSRGATEWERYAAQLAAAGRVREAIRAWYHAVLVTSYSAHILHYRKGRTNWEYVAAISPRIEWRPELVQLTKRFEQEWYGSDRSSREALEECSASAQRILEAIRRTARGAA